MPSAHQSRRSSAPRCDSVRCIDVDQIVHKSHARQMIDYYELVDALEREGLQVVLLPYGRGIAERVRRGREAGDARVAFVIPARTDTKWFHDCSEGEIRFLRGRIRFPGERSGAPFPSAVVIFGRRPATRFWDLPGRGDRQGAGAAVPASAASRRSNTPA